ncbi:alpha/beta fold hydrolase [Halobaculum sp. D14]|uniref:alpha/beta fold hydrolase n=1 Tax=Halobaculum sp. D14 TaxID=3421642 RepID=UPI003EB763E0
MYFVRAADVVVAPMSIYRSPAGRQALETVYAEAVDELDVTVDEEEIDTRHGSTHILMVGPEHGQPVLVFHGGNATNPMTLAWFTGLADDYRLISPDIIGQPGHSAETRLDPQGDGYGEWVVDLLDAFDLHSAPMIGTSYGSGIILRTAALAPERIERAALVVPAGFGIGPLLPMLKVGLPAILYRFLGSDWLLDLVLSEMVTQAEADPVVRETIAASLRHVELEREFPEADAAELEAFTAPVAVFAAENDPFFPPDAIIPRARDRVPDLTETEVLAEEKHILSPTGQGKVTESIRGFFET